MSDFEKFEEELYNKEKYCSFLTDTKINYIEYDHVVIVWKIFEVETIKDYLDFYLTCDILS